MNDSSLPTPTPPVAAPGSQGGGVGGGASAPPPTTISQQAVPGKATPQPVPPQGLSPLQQPVAPASPTVSPVPGSSLGSAAVTTPTTTPPPTQLAANPAKTANIPKAETNTTIQQPGKKAKGPTFANIKSSPFKFLPLILGGGLLLLVILFIIMRLLGGRKQSQSVSPSTTSDTSGQQTVSPSKQVTLTYWGLWEDEDVITPVLKEFEQSNPGVLVNYVKQSYKDYRERLQTAISSGRGPDVFRFHASWTPMLANELAPIPTSVMSASQFKSEFYPIASEQLQLNGQYVGIPLMYDGLMLYYNKEALATANAQPPQTWSELRELAVKLTIRSSDGIERAGLAIGNASNVDHFSDIIGLLLYQNGADLSDPTSKEALEALIFYSNFEKTDKVWSSELPPSTIAFARGDVAMMFAPSWRVHEITKLNPSLNFATAPVPKLGSQDITWASYWAEGVNVQSENSEEAWSLLKFLSSSETMQKLYSQESQTRAFGEPFSKPALATTATSPYLEALYTDAPNAKSWYLNSLTHDNGINDLMINYYADAINSLLSGEDSETVGTTLRSGVSQILRQYTSGL